jgi:tetratricopeptide (TPR) repeat protein
MPQTELQKIRSRLRRYERALAQEKKKYGDYSDGAGKRYEIGPLYMLLGDQEGAVAAFEWFEREFEDDSGRPDHLLCWSLALHRAGDEAGAAKKLRQAMLSNLYLIPHLLGRPIAEHLARIERRRARLPGIHSPVLSRSMASPELFHQLEPFPRPSA